MQFKAVEQVSEKAPSEKALFDFEKKSLREKGIKGAVALGLYTMSELAKKSFDATRTVTESVSGSLSSMNPIEEGNK